MAKKIFFMVIVDLLLASSIFVCNAKEISKEQSEIVLYCSVDQKFAEQVIKVCETQTGIKIKPRFDTEASKTTGLVNRIRMEKDNPYADVFWSSEIFNTIKLAEEGLLTSYESPNSRDFPSQYRDPNSFWTAFGLRSRVICYNTELVKSDDIPKSIFDLTSPRFNNKVVIADPRFGTTRGHMGALLSFWGQDKFTDFIKKLKDNGVRLVNGNSTAVRMVARGDAHVCLTDTDDVWVAQWNDKPVEMVFPDQDDFGTLVIPNTVCMVKGGPNPEASQKVIDFLLSGTVEKMLALSDSHNFPVHKSVQHMFPTLRPPKTMSVEYSEAADSMTQAIKIADQYLR